MFEEIFDVNINLMKNQLLNARLQVLAQHPTVNQNDVGFVYWNTDDHTAYCWTGTIWFDLGKEYVHPLATDTDIPTTALAGAEVISKIKLDSTGHPIGIEKRSLTPANIGAAAASHTHAFTQITGVPANTILGNNNASTGNAKALTVSDLMTLLAIVYGNYSNLVTGTNIEQSTWSAKQLNDWLAEKLTGYLTAVDLALGARTSTTMAINNSAGDGVVLPSATDTLAGLFTAAEKVKLTNIAENANYYVHTTGLLASNPFATESTSGLDVLSKLVFNAEGHPIEIKKRTLTAADIASVMIDDAINNGTNTTWSSTKIYDELQNAINQAQTGALQYKGDYNPATNVPAITTDTSIKIGYTYVVTATGTFASQPVEAGDMIIAKADNPGSTAANWQIVNKNIPAIVAATTTVAGIIMLASTAEGIAGTNNTKAVTPAVLKAVFDSKMKAYVATFGDNVSTTFDIQHDGGTLAVLADIQRVSDGMYIRCQRAATTTNIVRISVNRPPATNAYRAIIYVLK